MLQLLIVVGALVGLLAGEYLWHSRARRRIPIRIHVNGIRGKSSVVRLIAAGLRAGDVRTWAKVTGTLPNVVDETGADIPIVRGSPPSIIEQRAVIAEAAAAGVQALVIECMALEPAFQRADERLIKPTIGVITNVRLDHEEVFGSSPVDIALALSNTIPRDGVLVTTNGAAVPVLREVAERRGTSLRVVEAQQLLDSVLDGFSYMEHKENIAVALAVCREVGVDPNVALAGMRSCQGDPGALRILSRSRDGKTLEFVNAMAANDPESTLLLFRRAVLDRGVAGPVLTLVNSRNDRPLRSRQLGRVLVKIPAQRHFLIGGDSEAVLKEALRAGVDRGHIEIMQTSEFEQVVFRLFEAVSAQGTVFAMGNTAGLGLQISRYFESLEVEYPTTRRGPP